MWPLGAIVRRVYEFDYAKSRPQGRGDDANGGIGQVHTLHPAWPRETTISVTREPCCMHILTRHPIRPFAT